jgi:hypothetical protein
MHIPRIGVLCLAIAVSSAAPALAQTWPERVHVSVNAAFQPTANDFTDRFEFESNVETGSTSSEFAVKAGPAFDVGFGYRFWRNLAAGVSVSFFTKDGVAQTTSSFPHPFFFTQPREVTGEATGIARSERVVHVQLQYLWNPTGPFRAVFAGGPSFFNVEQDLVSEVVINEAFPYDTATFTSVQTRRGNGSVVAFNVGADVIWMLGRKVGVGGLVRFSRTEVNIDAPANRTVRVDAGGVYAGGGLRVLF